MDQTDRDILKLWVRHIQFKITLEELYDLIMKLQEHGILYHLVAEEVEHLAETSIQEAIHCLVDDICTCGSHAFHSFCTALESIDQNDLCKELTRIGHLLHRCIHCVKMNSSRELHCPIPDPYFVATDPRGHILIINNSFKHLRGRERSGSEKDVARLLQVFHDLHYETHIRSGMSKEEMIAEIEDFVMQEYHLNCGAAGLIIMSHGLNNGFLYDNNNRLVHLNNLLRPLKCDISNLLDKPVFVLIQACRGELSNQTTLDLNRLLLDGVGGESVSTAVGSEDPVMKLQDIIIVYSCLPSFISGRDPTEGSFFMQAFCEVLREHGATSSFTDLCILVSAKDFKYAWKNNMIANVVPQVASFLRKTFYLSTKYTKFD